MRAAEGNVCAKIVVSGLRFSVPAKHETENWIGKFRRMLEIEFPTDNLRILEDWISRDCLRSVEDRKPQADGARGTI